MDFPLADYVCVCSSESSSTIVFPSQPIPLAAYQIEFEDNGTVCTGSLHGHCIWMATVGLTLKLSLHRLRMFTILAYHARFQLVNICNDCHRSYDLL